MKWFNTLQCLCTYHYKSRNSKLRGLVGHFPREYGTTYYNIAQFMSLLDKIWKLKGPNVITPKWKKTVCGSENIKNKKRKKKFGTRKRVEVDIVSEFEGPTQFTKAEAVQQQIPVGPKLKRKKRKKEKKTLITHTHNPQEHNHWTQFTLQGFHLATPLVSFYFLIFHFLSGILLIWTHFCFLLLGTLGVIWGVNVGSCVEVGICFNLETYTWFQHFSWDFYHLPVLGIIAGVVSGLVLVVAPGILK